MDQISSRTGRGAFDLSVMMSEQAVNLNSHGLALLGHVHQGGSACLTSMGFFAWSALGVSDRTIRVLHRALAGLPIFVVPHLAIKGHLFDRTR